MVVANTMHHDTTFGVCTVSKPVEEIKRTLKSVIIGLVQLQRCSVDYVHTSLLVRRNTTGHSWSGPCSDMLHRLRLYGTILRTKEAMTRPGQTLQSITESSQLFNMKELKTLEAASILHMDLSATHQRIFSEMIWEGLKLFKFFPRLYEIAKIAVQDANMAAVGHAFEAIDTFILPLQPGKGKNMVSPRDIFASDPITFGKAPPSDSSDTWNNMKQDMGRWVQSYSSMAANSLMRYNTSPNDSRNCMVVGSLRKWMEFSMRKVSFNGQDDFMNDFDDVTESDVASLAQDRGISLRPSYISL
eukprot:GHVU01088979.1.p1 GENE.GHVU01088979.1~~GHVU01088979.1.p1  ORF type:complete len:301 (-),score=28.74 GHVU01088979.1:488-1390(-)